MANSREKPLERFVSKADTLQVLSGLLTKSSIEKLYVFSESDWKLDEPGVIAQIKDKFQGKTIVVRSSALNEDTVSSSNAGAFRSVLHIDSSDGQAIGYSVENVIGSYRERSAGNPDNRVLVQAQTLDVAYSGIVLTRNYNGSPYYVVNYSEGVDTTSVTSGQRSKSVKILKSGKANIPPNFKNLVEAVQEIEGLTSIEPLDIEFAVKNKDQVVTFQVRPLVTAAKDVLFDDAMVFDRVDKLKNKFRDLSQRRSHLAGSTTYFGDMPDWNPAEIIGSSPHTLAYSLYDEIITDRIWHRARTSQGYTDVDPAKLVVLFGNKPYVDIRNTFNSFTPASLPSTLREKLVGFYLEKLRRNPQLQDKVEFDVLYTCYDLSFDRRSKELLRGGFLPEEVSQLRTALLDLTNNLLDSGAISTDLEQNEALDQYRQSLPVLKEASSPQEKLVRASHLLDACKESGTLQFSRLARLGFIGKILLRSLVTEGAIDNETYYGFLGSINTVASNFAYDITQLGQGRIDRSEFLKKYGHLRPGTYDITVPRYDQAEDYFSAPETLGQSDGAKKGKFELSTEKQSQISDLLNVHGLRVNSQELFEFVRSALEAREYSKFLFTRCLSDAIELIAQAGETLGFSREDLSHLGVEAIRTTREGDSEFIRTCWSQEIERNRAEYLLNNYLLLPPVIISEEDFEVASYYDSRPNFITDKRIQGDLVLLKGGEVREAIAGKIVLLEAADPGYDWLFTKKPMGLITKYGGPASHMAIRCAELGLPAIIGSGSLYDSLLYANSVILDCENQKIELKGVFD